MSGTKNLAQWKYEPILSRIAPLPRGPEVIVVGGGVAGAYAAFHLSRLGARVTILDKGPGRLQTARLAQKGEFNLGGMRYPDTHRFLADAIDQAGLADAVEPFANTNPNAILHLRGRRVRRHQYRELAAQYDAAHLADPKALLDELWSSVLKELGSEDGELAIEQTLRRGHEYGYVTFRDVWRRKGLTDDQIAYLAHLAGIYQYIDTPIGELAVDRFSLYGASQYYRLKDGMAALPARLRHRSNAEVIASATVEAVETGGAGGVRVHYHTPSGNRSLAADFVIASCPANAVANIRFDTSSLPAEQLEAFREVGYASASKTLVEATEPFWLNDGIDGGIDWTDLPLQQVVFPQGIKRGPATFVASYTWQDYAKRMMSITDAGERFERVVRDLEQLHPGAGSYLRRYQHIDWDAAAQGGAFAYFKPGDYHRYHALLCKPHPVSDPRVFFCGEHVGLHHGWAESALQSAQWAVLQLLGVWQ